jgi:hypothetical protein
MTTHPPRATLVLALLFAVCSSANAQTDGLKALKKGNWDDSRSIYQLLKGDTLILSKSEKRVWKFKLNGNVKGYDWVIYCSRVPKWRRNEHPWSKFGKWSAERRSDGEYLHLDFYTGKRVLRYVETTASGIVLVVVEAPEKKLLE